MKVRCIDDECVYDFIKNGEIYEVESETFTSYRLKGIKDSYLKRRFEIVKDSMKEYTIQEIFGFEDLAEFNVMDPFEGKVRINKAVLEVDIKGVWVDAKMSIGWLNAKFTPIKKSKQVDFMEAMKAFDSGKTIKVKYEAMGSGKNKEKVFEPTVIGGVGYLSDCSLSPHLILNGTWFIES